MFQTEFYLKDAALPFLRLEGSATAKVGDNIPLNGLAYRVVCRSIETSGRRSVTKLVLEELPRPN